MLVLIDNYDSFTYNLVHFLGELGAACKVFRNDKISVAEVLRLKPKGIVLSPGPCTPNEAGICLELIETAGPKVPPPAVKTTPNIGLIQLPRSVKSGDTAPGLMGSSTEAGLGRAGNCPVLRPDALRPRRPVQPVA